MQPFNIRFVATFADTLVPREAYVDGDATNAHLKNVGPIFGKLLAGPAEMTSLHLMGPADELEKVKPGADGMGAVYTYTAAPAFTNVPADKLTGTTQEDLPHTFMRIYPTLSVTDWDEAQKTMDTLVEAARSEKGCIYYGFTQNKQDNKLICREAYVDGDAVNAHLANVGPILGAALESGVLKMESIVVSGPADQLKVAKASCDGLNPVYQEVICGFSRYSME